MGLRFNTGIKKAASLMAATITAFMFISCISSTTVFAGALSAEEKQQQIAEQKAQEQQTASQKAQDQQKADAVLQEQIRQEALHPGTATYLRATTSTKTDGISKADLNKRLRYVSLKWTAAENATKYVVYYSYKKDGTYKKVSGSVKTTKKTKMLFPNNKEVFLKVLSYHGSNKGTMSESVVIWPGYGAYVNAGKAVWKAVESVIFTGYSSTFSLTTTASMLKTYKIKWSSSNPKVAKVSGSGKVTAVANGTATITARTHTGFKTSKTITVKTLTPKVVPDVVGLSPSKAKKMIQAAGFKVTVKKAWIRKKDMNKKYPGVEFGEIMKQSKKAGSKLSRGSSITITYGDEIYYCGEGVEAMVQWAEKVAADNSYGYSMGVYTGRGLDRLCPYTNLGASKDYDCATFVNAALAFSGMGQDFMNASVKPSPVVRGVRNLLVKNDWKRVRIKHKYKKNGKTRYYYTNPKVSQLKRGDIVLNCACHIQIHVGKGFDVGAHNNYDGRTGDSSGREVSVNYSWSGYNEVYRYYGKIGK